MSQTAAQLPEGANRPSSMVEARWSPCSRPNSTQQRILNQLHTTTRSLGLLSERQSEMAEHQSEIAESQSEIMLSLDRMESNTSEKLAVWQPNTGYSLAEATSSSAVADICETSAIEERSLRVDWLQPSEALVQPVNVRLSERLRGKPRFNYRALGAHFSIS